MLKNETHDVTPVDGHIDPSVVTDALGVSDACEYSGWAVYVHADPRMVDLACH